MSRNEPKFLRNWKEQAQRLRKEAHTFYFVFKHPGTPWYIRCAAGCSVAYILSPVQLIPNFIPVIGFLDDFLVLLLGAKVVCRFAPPDLLRECRKLADAAENRRRENVEEGIVRFAILLVVMTWFLGAFAGSVLARALLSYML